MHPRISELLEYLDAQAENLRAAYESVPPGERALRPSTERWSPAENVHHLTIVEERVALRLASLIEEARRLPPENSTEPLFPMDLATRVERRDQRFSTSEASTPRDTDAGRIWDDFLSARRKVKSVVADGDGLRLGEVRAPHPVFGPISAYEWVAFCGAHAARHAGQIREGRELQRSVT